MCGIAGIAGAFESNQAVAAVKAMTSVLARRGPDHQGLSHPVGAVLGHRRLAIFDLSAAGNQPMCSSDGRITVVFNGAIYNFKELRATLANMGYSFRSGTDTEVLLHGYDAWGIGPMTERLRGMFAFAIWDERERKLFLVRDRLGVKPLLYAAARGTIAFASTARALQRAGYGGALRPDAVAHYLRSGFVADRHCIYEGIQKLPPATILEWHAGQARHRRYWRRPPPGSSGVQSFAQAVAATEERLLDAVALRLNADVPVGILLSGGIDSALVCWAAAQLGADLTAYTVALPGDEADEAAAAARTARLLKIRHRIVPMPANESLETGELVAAFDEPFACSSALAMLRVSRAVAPSAKVLLTGDGGDDVFLGYPRHRHLWLADRTAAALPPAVSAAWNRWGAQLPRPGSMRRAAALMDYASRGLPAFLAAAQQEQAAAVTPFLGPRLAGAPADAPMPSAKGAGMLAAYIDFDCESRFTGEYLRKIDGATMHHSIEARSPFLDQELWELGCALPLELRLRHGRLKAVLRELALTRIGARVALGKKRGFRIPVARWLRGPLLGEVAATMRDSLAAKQGWIDAGQIVPALRHGALDARGSEAIWRVYVLERWLRHEKAAGEATAAVMPARVVA
jgi:asparagine synthase (glutamine-hydrolysing)